VVARVPRALWFDLQDAFRVPLLAVKRTSLYGALKMGILTWDWVAKLMLNSPEV
jgi:hypothetical protein